MRRDLEKARLERRKTMKLKEKYKKLKNEFETLKQDYENYRKQHTHYNYMYDSAVESKKRLEDEVALFKASIQAYIDAGVLKNCKLLEEYDSKD